MTWFDGLIIAVVLLSAIISFFRGFVREAISLGAWVCGIVFALRYGADLGGVIFGSFLKSPTMQYVLGFIVILLGALIIGMIINIVIRGLMQRRGISFVDGAAGIIFGVARGVLVVSVIILLIESTQLEQQPGFRQSLIAPHFQSVVTWLARHVAHPFKKMA